MERNFALEIGPYPNVINGTGCVIHAVMRDVENIPDEELTSLGFTNIRRRELGTDIYTQMTLDLMYLNGRVDHDQVAQVEEFLSEWGCYLNISGKISNL